MIESVLDVPVIGAEFETATYAVWEYCFAEMRDEPSATILTQGLMEPLYYEAKGRSHFDGVKALRRAISHFDTYGEKQEHYTRNQKVALYLAEGVGLAPDETAHVMHRSVKSAIRLTREAHNIAKIHGLPIPV